MKKIVFTTILMFLLLVTGSFASNIDGTKTYEDYLFILVHGFHATEKTFDNGLKDYLEKPVSAGGLGLKGYVYAYSFSNPDGSVIEQAKELGDRDYSNPAEGMNDKSWLEKAREDFKVWYAREHPPMKSKDVPLSKIPTKYILLTHSMGNFAARAYIYSDYMAGQKQYYGLGNNYYSQGFYQDDVSKVVMVAPPLLGSEMIPFLWLKASQLGMEGSRVLVGSENLQNSWGWVFSLKGIKFSTPKEMVQGIVKTLSDPVTNYLISMQNDPFAPYQIVSDLTVSKFATSFAKNSSGGGGGSSYKLFDPYCPALQDLFPYSPVIEALKQAELTDATNEPAYSIVYGQGVPIFDPVPTLAPIGLRMVDEDRKLYQAVYSSDFMRLGDSMRGTGKYLYREGGLSEDEDREKVRPKNQWEAEKNQELYDLNDYNFYSLENKENFPKLQSNMPSFGIGKSAGGGGADPAKLYSDIINTDFNKLTLLNPGFWNIPTAQGKFYSLISSRLGGGFFTRDGDGFVATVSAKGGNHGEEVKALKAATRYPYLFKVEHFENYLNGQFVQEAVATEGIIAGAAYFSSLSGVPYDVAWSSYWWMRIPLALSFLDKVYYNEEGLMSDLGGHWKILKQHDLIKTAILDTPAIFTVQDLQTTLEATATATDEGSSLMSFSVSSPEAGYRSIKVMSIKENRAYAGTSNMAVPTTLDSNRKYLTNVTVTEAPQRVAGKLNYLVPQLMKSFEYSFNFAAWKSIANVDPKTGEFYLDDLPFAEGQNVLAVRSINAVDVASHQVCKIILNTIKPRYYAFTPVLSLPQMA